MSQADGRVVDPIPKVMKAQPYTIGATEAYELIGTDEERSVKESEEKSFSWGWELVTLSLSFIAVAAQVLILVIMRDKPYYATWKLSLSLNTVLAILTTASKAAQLHAVSGAIGQLKWVDFKHRAQRLDKFEVYDEASRGPRGALQFLFRVRWGFATLGALVTVLGLAVDPATQNVVALRPRNTTIPDDTVVFGYSYEYNTHPAQTGVSTYNTPEASTRDPGMQGAIMKGIFNIQTSPEFRCGGACRWNETYRSIGFSSLCQNVTQATTATKVCSKAPGEVTTICNMTTPLGIALSTSFVSTDSATVVNVAANGTLLGQFVEHPPPEFMRIAVFRSTSGPDTAFEGEGIINEEVTDCSLSVAMHEYQDITANGSNLIIGSHRKKALDGWYLNIPTYAPGPDPFNGAIVFNQSEGTLIEPEMSISVLDWVNMVLFFKSSAFTTHMIAGSTPDSDGGIGQVFIKADIPVTFDALAESMTDYLRSLASGPNTKQGSGVRVEHVIFVSVRWKFFILPLAVEMGAIIFVASVIVLNSRNGIPAWKSSALALLVHHYNVDEGTLTTTSRGPGQVERESKRVAVRL